MRSIDNLRDYVLTAPSICSTTRAILVGYIDNIEREVADGWVRKSKEHVVSYATVEVKPHIDWSHMADELDVFTQLVRGFAEQVEEDA